MIRFLILVFYYYLPVGFYIILIYILSSISVNVNNLPVISNDKFMHALEYSVLGFLFMRAYLNTAGLNHKIRGIFTTVVFAFLLGSFDEYHQLFVPGRVVSLKDILADTIGGFIGSIFYILVLYIRFRKERVYGQNNKV
jgi:VanZ family protein